jgi:hypothetical protein
MKKYCLFIAGLAVLVSLPSCGKRSSRLQNKVHQEQEDLNRKVTAKEESYKQKSVADLITELESVALKGKEPFNSLAFREIVRRRDGADQIAQSIQSKEQKEYFKVMALSKINPELYKRLGCDLICAVLTASLQKSVVFNGWGIPHLYWESSAKAIVECGPIALPYLTPLLRDKRPAPVWGSEEAAESEKYHYRVCDYAYALMGEINGQKWEIQQRAEERDKAIEAQIK